MTIGIDWLATTIAVVVGLAVAWVWYADWGLLGPTWRGLTGVTKADSQRVGLRPFVVLVFSVVVTAIALAVACGVVFEAVGTASVWTAVLVAIVVWVGFSASTLAQHNGFEQKPVRLTVVNAGYQLVLFVAMAVPIGLLPAR